MIHFYIGMNTSTTQWNKLKLSQVDFLHVYFFGMGKNQLLSQEFHQSIHLLNLYSLKNLMNSYTAIN